MSAFGGKADITNSRRGRRDAAATTISWYRSVESPGHRVAPAGPRNHGLLGARHETVRYDHARAADADRAGPGGRTGECRVAEHLVQNDFPLPRASKALDAKRLDILVLGGGSSMLPGASESKAYPSRLQNVLAQKLPNISIKVTVDTKSRRNAAEALRTIPQDLATAKPNLVVWQAGVSDAMQGVDPEAFSATLNKGVETAHAAAADVILMNTQYSPRTASMIALSTYLENMHWVALQREVPCV